VYKNLPATPTAPRPRDEQRRADRLAATILDNPLLTVAEAARWAAVEEDADVSVRDGAAGRPRG
jgi:hypothetical protein